METLSSPSKGDLAADLRKSFPEATDEDVEQAVAAGLSMAQHQAEFANAAMASAGRATAPMGFDTSRLFKNYADCDSKAKSTRDAALAATGAIPNIILRMAAVVAANAAYVYAQGVCHRMYPKG
jgi:hypothetical protein